MSRSDNDVITCANVDKLKGAADDAASHTLSLSLSLPPSHSLHVSLSHSRRPCRVLESRARILQLGAGVAVLLYVRMQVGDQCDQMAILFFEYFAI